MNGDLQEEVYMEQPKGFIEKSISHLVCKLQKSLYGLKHAPHSWFEKLYESLIDLGFTSAKSDQSLFTRFTMDHTTFLLVYVDHILVTGNNPSVIQQLISQLNKSFSFKDLGEIDYFLGIQVKHITEGLHLSQTKYVHDLLCKAKMNNANGMNTPMISGQQLTASGSGTVQDIQLYKSVVCALQYVTITRPEISFCVNRVCQYLKDPQEEHWQAVKRILRYLKNTIQYGLHLTYSSTLNLVGFCDADWASSPYDRRSTFGYCVYLGNNLVSWCSKKQHIVSRSSIEAEYRSLAGITAKITWLTALLSELRLTLPRTPAVWCDNLSIVLLSANPILHARTKHIELDLYFVREKVIQKLIDVRHVPSSDQIADLFTKAIPSSRFSLLRSKLRVLDLSTLSLREDVRIIK